MLTIDGARGEGGGQILRTALSLSLFLQQPFRIVNLRAQRSRPGLLAQHLAAVRAAAAVGRARVTGAQLHSRELIFAPTGVAAGDYRFDIGTAGSTGLVLQTVLPALVTAPGVSTLVLEGGTHNPLAPTFEFLQQAFLPLIGRMGARVDAELHRPGFYPVGGGLVRVRIQPVARLEPLQLVERGAVREVHASALMAHLPRHIGERELRVIGAALALPAVQLELVDADAARGPGNAVSVVVRCEQVTEVFTGFGQKGVAAEAVAAGVVAEVQRYLAADVPVAEHLADQLLIPLALAGGGRFRTLAPSGHTRTNMKVIERLSGRRFTCSEVAPDVWEIATD
jgi:RNA 3'-terminal phosphate cyclase (ATP)